MRIIGEKARLNSGTFLLLLYRERTYGDGKFQVGTADVFLVQAVDGDKRRGLLLGTTKPSVLSLVRNKYGRLHLVRELRGERTVSHYDVAYAMSRKEVAEFVAERQQEFRSNAERQRRFADCYDALADYFTAAAHPT